MNKSGTFIATALLTLGLTAASMAADAPKTTETAAADTAVAPDAHKHSSKSSKKHGKHRHTAAAPMTTK